MNARNSEIRERNSKIRSTVSFGATCAMREVLGQGMFKRLRSLGSSSTFVAKHYLEVSEMKELEKVGCVYFIGKVDGGHVYAATRKGAELVGLSEEKIEALGLPSFAAWYP